MVVNKIFHRKTKRGNILKVVREHYLREDVACELFGCRTCRSVPNGKQAHLLKNISQRPSPTSTVSKPHLIVIDSNVILHQLDVLSDEIFTDVVVPQTVVEEIKKRSPPAFKKLKDLVACEGRNFFIFQNEFCQATFIERKPGESANDRNDRAIRRVAEWYAEHMKSIANLSEAEVILLSDDAENLSRATASGISGCTVESYVKGVPNRPDLIDKLATRSELFTTDGKTISKNSRRHVEFPEHKSIAELRRGISSGIYKRGSFQVSRENYLEANVYVDSDEREQIFIQGLLNCNRAVHDDIVVVEILPRDEWTCPAALLKVQELDADRGDEVSDEEDDEIKRAVPKRGKMADLLPTGRVIGILKRNWRPYCGVLEPSPIPGAVRHLFIPAEKRVPRIRIETRQAELLRGQRLIVSIDSWPKDSRYPCGHFVRALGKLGDRKTENEVLLLEHDVPHEQFSGAVLNCLPKLPWEITQRDTEARQDLRHLDIFSVDPPGCTDIDDALHCRMLDENRLEVGVHIADVSHFVHFDTAMDEEAKRRGTTVYLVDRRIDMLPTLLSSNLCSLLGNEDRFAFTVIWQLSMDGEVLNTRFCKSIIRSRAAMTYAEAQAKIDDKTCEDLVARGLRLLNNTAKILRKKRMAQGALTLASLEIRFRIDSETHDPIDVQAKQMLETNSMVEEFMLLANVSVAQKILDEFPSCALLRRHQTPPLTNYEPLIKAAEARGFKIAVDNGKALAASLDVAQIPENPFFNTLLRMLATRCMTQARYFCSGSLDREHYFHFGLAMPIYTHFTSPIRRYADLVVHRLLASAIGASNTYPQLLDKKYQEKMCENLNYRHRMAQYAGRASVLLNTHLFFRNKTEELEGYIMLVRRNAFQVLMPKYGLESAVLLQKDCPLKFDEEQVALRGPENLILRMFDRVVVRLSIDSSDMQHEKLKLELVEPALPGFSVEPLVQAKEDDIEPPTKKAKISLSDQ